MCVSDSPFPLNALDEFNGHVLSGKPVIKQRQGWVSVHDVYGWLGRQPHSVAAILLEEASVLEGRHSSLFASERKPAERDSSQLLLRLHSHVKTMKQTHSS